jgi:hypothetical protein
LAWKSCLKVPLLPIRPSGTILLSDLVRSTLQIVMAIWHTFLILSAPNSLQRAPTPDLASSNLKKVCLLYLTGWASQPSEDISLCITRSKEPLCGYNTAFVSDKYEGVKGHKTSTRICQYGKKACKSGKTNISLRGSYLK